MLVPRGPSPPVSTTAPPSERGPPSCLPPLCWSPPESFQGRDLAWLPALPAGPARCVRLARGRDCGPFPAPAVRRSQHCGRIQVTSCRFHVSRHLGAGCTHGIPKAPGPQAHLWCRGFGRGPACGHPATDVRASGLTPLTWSAGAPQHQGIQTRGPGSPGPASRSLPNPEPTQAWPPPARFQPHVPGDAPPGDSAPALSCPVCGLPARCGLTHRRVS